MKYITGRKQSKSLVGYVATNKKIIPCLKNVRFPECLRLTSASNVEMVAWRTYSDFTNYKNINA